MSSRNLGDSVGEAMQITLAKLDDQHAHVAIPQKIWHPAMDDFENIVVQFDVNVPPMLPKGGQFTVTRSLIVGIRVTQF